MDLLTADGKVFQVSRMIDCADSPTPKGWSPSYSIPAVLMQIKLAISNTDPRPARLDASHWNT